MIGQFAVNFNRTECETGDNLNKQKNNIEIKIVTRQFRTNANSQRLKFQK